MHRAVGRRVGAWLLILVGAGTGCQRQHSTLSLNEDVQFFPTVGWQDADGEHWHAEVHGWIHEPRLDASRLRWLLEAVDIDGFEIVTAGLGIIAERLALFLIDNEIFERVWLQSGTHCFRVAPSAEDGHFFGEIKLPAALVADLPPNEPSGTRMLRFRARPEHRHDYRRFVGEVRLIAPEGWSVVCDIDDTVKVTEVAELTSLLTNTFLQPYQAIEGMPALLRSWEDAYHATFHYVSNSPWQLYAPLAAFWQEAGLPAGSFHLRRLDEGPLRETRWDERSHKQRVIRRLLEIFPRRQFVFVGDTADHDPEIYGAICRDFPQQVRLVLLHEVSGAGGARERLQAALRGVPDGRVVVYRDAAELRNVPWP